MQPFALYVCCALGIALTGLAEGERDPQAPESKALTVLRGFKGSAVRSLAFSPDGKYLAFTGHEKKHLVMILDLKTHKVVKTLDGFIWAVPGLAFSPDSTFIATAGFKDGLKVWDTNTWKTVQDIGLAPGIVRYTEKGTVLAALSHNRLDFFNAKDFTKILTLRPKLGDLYNGTFCWDSSIVALGTNKGDIQLLDWRTEKELATWKAHDIAIRTMQFSRDGKWLASAGQGESIARLWDGKSGEARHLIVLDKGFGSVRQVAFSHAGNLVAVAGEHVKIPVYQTSTGEKVFDLAGQNNLFECVSFSPDGTLAVGGANDGSIYIWQMPKKAK